MSASLQELVADFEKTANVPDRKKYAYDPQIIRAHLEKQKRLRPSKDKSSNRTPSPKLEQLPVSTTSSDLASNEVLTHSLIKANAPKNYEFIFDTVLGLAFKETKDKDSQESNIFEYAVRTNNLKLVKALLEYVDKNCFLITVDRDGKWLAQPQINMPEFLKPMLELAMLNSSSSIYCAIKETIEKRVAELAATVTISVQDSQFEHQFELIDGKIDQIREAYPRFKASIEKYLADIRSNALAKSNFQIIAAEYSNVNFKPLAAGKYENSETEAFFTNKKQVLTIAKNPNDIAYLLKKFDRASLLDAADARGYNVLHLAMEAKNINIFQYVVNHFGYDLLYRAGHDGKTPVHLAYEAITKTGELKDRFAMLAILDQLGVDLHLPEYDEIYKAYQASLKADRPYVLVKSPQSERDVTKISFNGGGVKGMAFVSAMQESISTGLVKPEKVTAYAGTSAGSINAFLFAFGYDINEASNELDKFDFAKLMDDGSTPAIKSAIANNIESWKRYWSEGRNWYLAGHLIYNAFGLNAALKELSKDVDGLFRPTYIQNKLVEMMHEKIKNHPTLKDIDPMDITFDDLKKCQNEFKDLIVYATNKSTGEVEAFSAKHNADTSVIDAVIASMSIPGFFVERMIYKIKTESINGKLKRIRDLESGCGYCDGGVGKNDPIDAHDIDGFNEEALTFLLVSPQGKSTYEKEINSAPNPAKNMVGTIARVVKMYQGAERKTYHQRDPRNKKRIVYINTEDIGTVDFDNTAHNKAVLLPSGQNAVIDYLNRATVNGAAELSNEMKALLISYKCTHRSYTNINGAVTELLPSCTGLSAADVVRIYAAAKDNELPLLRSIINPNVRDAAGVSALSIARYFQFNKTAERLVKSGANTIDGQAKAPLDAPAYFKEGEASLENTDREQILKERFANKIESGSHASENERLAQELEAIMNDNARLQQQNTHLVQKNQSLLTKLKSYIKSCWLILFRSTRSHQVNELLQQENGQLRANLAVATTENGRLHAELANSNTEVTQLRSTVAQLQQRLDDEAQLRKLAREKQGSPVQVAIAALRKHRLTLQNRMDVITALPASQRDKALAHFNRLNDKCQGIDEIITRLTSDFTRAAGDIINVVKGNHAQLFKSYWWNWHCRTRNRCYEIEQAEKVVSRTLGATGA